MKALKIIIIVLVVIVGAYSIWMATIDPEYHVKREAVIDAEPSAVYATVSDFTTWKNWSKWHKMDPDMEVTYGDKSAGEGATYSWKGEKAGAGTQTITAAVPNKSMETHIAFEGMGESDGYWKFEPTEDGKTRVIWGFTGESPFFFRVMNLGMDKMVGRDFEEGLTNLKSIVESQPKAPKVEIKEVNMEPVTYYGIKHKVSFDQIQDSKFYAENYEKIGNYLGEDAQNMSMPPFAIFYTWDEKNKMTNVEIAMAATSEKPGNETVKKSTTKAGKALKAVHVGGYDTEAEHTALGDYMQSHGYTMPEGAGAWEVYVTDPGEEPDTAKWVTEIIYPVEKAKKAESAASQEENKG